MFNEFRKSLPHPTHLSCRNTRSPSRYALEFIGFTRVYWRVGVFGGIKNARAYGTICIFLLLLLLLDVPHSAKPPAHLRCAVRQHPTYRTTRLSRPTIPRTPSAAYGPDEPQVQTYRRRSASGWPTSRSPNRPPSRNRYSPATDAEPAGTRNKPGMTSVPIYFCTFSVFQPSTLNSPFIPQSNFSGFSKPITRSALGFLSLSASATLVSVLFSTNEP